MSSRFFCFFGADNYWPRHKTRAALSYSARRYTIQPFAAAKMSRATFLSEALYEADKALKKFA